MKIAILTVYNSMNFGSFLQAYALSHYLKSLNHEVYFPCWNKEDNSAWNIIKPIIFSRDIGMRGVIAGLHRVKAFRGIIEQNLVETKLGDFEEYDLVIIGSDTLWDIAREKFRNPVLYGDIKSAKKIITYAVSCSNSKEEDFEKYMYLTEKIQKIHAISVRDEHTFEVIHNVLEIETSVVCDPTILVNRGTWKIDNVQIDISNSILVYAYEMNKHMIEVIRNFAKDRNLKLVSLCMYHYWCDEHINCTPLEFPSYIKKSKYFVTNTFHGSVFSILTEASYIPIRNGYKLRGLLIDCFGRDISLPVDVDYKSFCNYVDVGVDFSVARNNIIQMREKSRAWLEEFIG